ncbi:MAG TPA: hypothetical protein VLR49_14250, partial [Ferruginibacter sp.]|nr:hypothetical protein [Ferruginibacter sp.]
MAGNYKGIEFFDFANGRYNTTNMLPGFNESSRFVAIDKKDQIWVSHPYHGIYKISKKSDGTYASTHTYTDKEGLPSTLNNHVYKIKNEVLAATEKGIYTYNQTKTIFEPADYYQN